MISHDITQHIESYQHFRGHIDFVIHQREGYQDFPMECVKISPNTNYQKDNNNNIFIHTFKIHNIHNSSCQWYKMHTH